jgi:hypothetical protein
VLGRVLVQALGLEPVLVLEQASDPADRSVLLPPVPGRYQIRRWYTG